MPFWGWILLIAGGGLLALTALSVIVFGTHRLREDEPLHGEPDDFAAPLPPHVAAADSMTERELEAERTRDSSDRPSAGRVRR